MKTFERGSETFKFSDGQEVFLREPTILQIQSAQKLGKGDDIETAKNLLINMSEGELDMDFLNSLPAREFMRLASCVGGFIDEKN